MCVFDAGICWIATAFFRPPKTRYNQLHLQPSFSVPFPLCYSACSCYALISKYAFDYLTGISESQSFALTAQTEVVISNNKSIQVSLQSSQSVLPLSSNDTFWKHLFWTWATSLVQIHRLQDKMFPNQIDGDIEWFQPEPLSIANALFINSR